MAPSPKHLSFFFLVCLCFAQIQARESKFFNKFNHFQKVNTTTVTINGSGRNTTTKEAEAPQAQPPNQQEEEQPSFTPQTNNGYGLYGHDNDQFPSTTTSNNYVTPLNVPHSTRSEEYVDKTNEGKELNTGYNNNNNDGYKTQLYDMSDIDNQNTKYGTQQSQNGNGNYGNYYNDNGNGYEAKQYGPSDTRLTENGENTYNNNNNGYETKQYGLSDTKFAENSNNNNGASGYETKQSYGNKNSWSDVKQEGMSDTRFMGNGNNNNFNNANGYETKQYFNSNGWSDVKQEGMGDTRFMENGNNNNNANGYETKQSNNNNVWSGAKGEGMSDTRTLENGKYFHNVNAEKSYPNQYQPVGGSNNGFESSKGVDSAYTGERYYKNNGNANEFNDSMEESQYQDEETQENQEGYIP